MLQIGFS